MKYVVKRLQAWQHGNVVVVKMALKKSICNGVFKNVKI